MVMELEKIRKRLLHILDAAPVLKEILLSSDSIEIKRKKIRFFLSEMLFARYDDNPSIPPFEWMMTTRIIHVFRNIISARAEQLVGFSFLNYLCELLHPEPSNHLPLPDPGFLSELEHLIKGITGKSDVYEGTVPAFLKHEGTRAARLRSSELSRMARMSQKFMNRYPCGLNSKTIRRRALNKSRILRYFNATDLEWDDWRWHTRHIIRDADMLRELISITDEDYQAIKLARKHKIPFGITPYYLSLMDNDLRRKQDYAIRSQVIPSMDYVQKMKILRESPECTLDFMMERDTSPIEGITRRYPRIVIIKPILTCPQICVYCQRNWEIEDVYSKKASMLKAKLDAAIRWIDKTPEINEVLITGGDPMLMSDERLISLLERLSRIWHIERIRIGTRMPITLPQRITTSLVREIRRFNEPGKREILIVTHVEHPYEITPQTIGAIQKFRQNGMSVYNQLVYTFFNSKKFEAAILRHQLRLIGVTPYYTFNTKGKEETDHYRVPIARLIQEQHEEARLMPGTVRTDEIVFNVPRIGKNYLRASQHHDVISILPDGRRVYEFHPWERKLAMSGTYIYKDVSIYHYLQRLKAIGENLSDYKTIWYYY